MLLASLMKLQILSTADRTTVLLRYENSQNIQLLHAKKEKKKLFNVVLEDSIIRFACCILDKRKVSITKPIDCVHFSFCLFVQFAGSQIWDRRCLNETNPKDVGAFSGHLDGITYIDSKKDARYLISNSKDQTIKLWDMRMFSPSVNTNQVSSRRRARYYNRWDYRWDTVPKECKYQTYFKQFDCMHVCPCLCTKNLSEFIGIYRIVLIAFAFVNKQFIQIR